MAKKLSFQDMILTFLNFWKEEKCLIWHPHNVQVGAGTMNPATILRVLGPEPWNVAYIEPSIRPDDGRFGDNPNRMQQHYQLQVILKPDPGNPQEVYLRSLEAIGIRLNEHDIRFVEDNWEQPALGAWGLGWEVWLDGQEITQFTYFQQAMGSNLDPVSVEITYGLDRIALALQEVDSVWEIDYGAGTIYGDLLLQSEIEHCRYYFDEAEVEALRRVYDFYEAEAERALAAGLVSPAHDFNLKCSWLFNVMDTRGAIGVTERANYFKRMRSVARKVADTYLEQRLRLEYPFMDNENWASLTDQPMIPATGSAKSDAPHTFVLEIGSEELPANDLSSAIKQLRAAVPEYLGQLRLDFKRVEVYGTPRRLAIIVHKLAAKQSDLELEVKGPPANRAFDPAGNPTEAALGFARSKGVKASDLRIITEADRRYAAATVREEGRSTPLVLTETLSELIAGIRFEKSMRWNSSNIAYSRPLRWLVALFGLEVIPFSYAGVISGRTSRGLRLHNSPDIVITDADSYFDEMASNSIILRTSERKDAITAAATKLAEEKGGIIREDPQLLSEVANLIEQPTLLRGRFEDRYLELPPEVLVAVMKKHQRYFPVYQPDGQNLLPYFITVRNGDGQHLDLVRSGNEHVIRARFADAEFFYTKDTSKNLEDFLEELDTLTFQSDLGSMSDKVGRLKEIIPLVAKMLQFTPEEEAMAIRAAELSKADLATSMVVEMTSLQGVMGGHYALQDGEPKAVAEAIAEQYNAVSETRPGLALALSDRLDSLLGLFAAGLAPKGSNDPFALRRAAIQIVENLIANEIQFDLGSALQSAVPLMPVPANEETVEGVLHFINNRLEIVLLSDSTRTSVVRAIIAEQGHNPFAAYIGVSELSEAIMQANWPELLNAYARCVRIVRGMPTYELQPELLSLPEEQKLWETYKLAKSDISGTVSSFVKNLERLEPAITGFFDNLLVMDEDESMRQNRLALLQLIRGLARGIVDLSLLEGF